jgi:hypothetical protein
MTYLVKLANVIDLNEFKLNFAHGLIVKSRKSKRTRMDKVTTPHVNQFF